jgi:tetratricopeptide (TPR) repeat protein
VTSLEAALAAFRSIDGLDADADALARFGQAAGWLSSTLTTLGRNDAARLTGTEGHRAATKVLDAQPTNMAALRARALTSSALASVADQELRQAERLRWLQAEERDWRAIATIDPSNTIAWNNLANAQAGIAQALSDMGRYREALAQLSGAEFERVAERTVIPSPILAYRNARAAFLAADLGQTRLSDELLARGERHAARYLERSAAVPFAADMWRAEWDLIRLDIATAAADPERMRLASRGLVERIEQLAAPNDTAKLAQRRLLRGVHFSLGRAALFRADYVEAADHFAATVRLAETLPTRMRQEEDGLARDRSWLAVALARQGRAEEAAPHAERALAFHRGVAVTKHDEMQAHESHARALYAKGLVTPAQANALFTEANALMATLPGEMRAARTTAYWQQLIATELRGRR